MQANLNNHPTNSASVQVNSTSQADLYNYTLNGFIAIGFPIFLLLGFIAFKKYRITLHRRRIEKLEKLWRININHNTF